MRVVKKGRFRRAVTVELVGVWLFWVEIKQLNQCGGGVRIPPSPYSAFLDINQLLRLLPVTVLSCSRRSLYRLRW
jgi:hypothetical protein